MPIKMLVAEKARLDEIAAEAAASLARAPEGSLKIDHPRKTGIRYRRTVEREDGRICSEYLPKEKVRLIERLAQKDYDARIVKRAEVESRIIGRCIDGLRRARGGSASGEECQGSECGLEGIIDVYRGLSDDRKKLVVPYVLPDDEYACLWESEEGRTRQIPSEGCRYHTERGDYVRSKSEVIIADKIYRAGLKYFYERPLHFERDVTVHPDFTILEVKSRKPVYWEHFGLMDDPEYREKALRKIALYAENGYVFGSQFIATFETGASPLDTRVIDEIIKKNFL